MPKWLEYIDFGMGLIGFVITLLTLGTAASVKKQIMHHTELSDFRNSADNIIQQIEGFIGSINDDKLYLKDTACTFKRTLTQFLIDIETRFLFFSRPCKKSIKKSLALLKKQKMCSRDWDKLVNQLIELKNSLRKELTYNG